MSRRNLVPRSASLTHLGWPTLGVFSKTNFIRRVSSLRSRMSTPSLRFSSSPMAPIRVSLSVPAMRSPLCPLSSPNPSPATLPSCSRILQVPSIGTFLGTPSQTFSGTLLSSRWTTRSCTRKSTSSPRVVGARKETRRIW